MTEFVALRPNTYSYLMDDGNSNKNAKGRKKCVVKLIIKFNDCKYCLLNNEIISKYLKIKLTMYIIKKSIRLHYVIMIKDWKLLIELHEILMVQVLEKYVNQSC